MRKFIYALFSAALLVSAVSCVLNDVIDGDSIPADGEAKVLLHLSVPGGFGSTRALTLPQEREIENVYVLEFDATNVDVDDAADILAMKLRYAPKKATVASNDVSLSVVLTPSGTNEKSILMCVANAEDIITSPTVSAVLTAGASYADVADAICGTITGKMYTSGGAIPMWGNSPAITIQNNSNNTTSVSLTRAVARIDVGVGGKPKNANDGTTTAGEWTWNGKVSDDTSADVPFKLARVYVFRPNKKYSVVVDDPVTKIESDGEVTATTLPGGQNNSFDYTPSPAEDLFLYTDVDANKRHITQQIYVPEADTKITATGTKGDVNHTNRMAIVVGGYYSPDPANPNTTKLSYYRLDFAENGDLMNVLRNHLYQFNIDSVTGDGYDDPVEAYESQAINMSCDVVAWNDDEINEGFDGTWHMNLSTNEMNFKSEGETQTLTLDTDYPDGWTAKMSASEDGTAVCDWLKFDNGLDNKEGTSSASAQTIVVNAAANPSTTAERTAWIIFKAGDRLKAKVKVLQPIAGIKAVYGVIGYIWNPGEPNHLQLTLDGDKDYFNGGPGELQSVQDDYTVHVAYFKFGSLVASSSQRISPFTSNNLVAWPTQWAPDRTAMAGKVSNWKSVPVSGALTKGATIVTDLTKGLGDPCDYYFGDGDGNGATATATENWRLPTAKENTVFVGGDPNSNTWKNWKPSNSTPDYSFDSTTGAGGGTSWPYYYSAAGVVTTTEGTLAAPASGHFPVAAQTGRAAFSEVIPVAGYRIYEGPVGYEGSSGLYWSSTAFSDILGYRIGISASGVFPASNSGYNLGGTVRCVQASPIVAAVAGGMGGTAKVTYKGISTPVITSAVGGNEVTFTATPGNNYTFRGWTATGITLDATQAATNPLTVTVPQGNKGVTLTATFGVDAVRQTSDDDVIGYIYHPGYPDHYTLTLDPDNNDDTDGSITYVALFKYGSLIALSSALAPPTGGFSADDVVHWPSEWAGSRTAMEGRFPAATPAANRFLSIYTPKTAFSNPAISDGTEFPTGEFQSFLNLSLGDACEYYFGQEYRIPSSAEWAADIASWGTYSWGAKSGDKPGEGKFGSVTLPAAGRRSEANGSPESANTYGYYWSSTGGKAIRFNSASAQVIDDANQTSANAIRCVETPVVSPVGEVEIPINDNPGSPVTVWAGSNLADMGIFAASADDDGKFFMWGRNDRIYNYNTSGTTYPSTTDQGGNTTWPVASDPCPAGGWRVPTKAEWDRFIGVMSNTTTNTGDRVYTFGTESITLPAAGYIDYTTKTGTGVGATGRYWTSDAPSANLVEAHYAGWNNMSAITTNSATYNKIGSASVRCVRTK